MLPQNVHNVEPTDAAQYKLQISVKLILKSVQNPD